MAVASDSARWEALAAARTRGEVGDGIASVLALLGRPDVISFAGGFPDPETFPRERIAVLLQEFAASGELSAFQYAPTRGLAGPLDAFATRLERLQGRRPADDELVVTSGAIEALELVGKSFLDPGDVVVVEAPTYLGAIQSFRSFESALAPVTLDEHGLAVDELEGLLAGGLRPKLVYTIPDHQNPAGVSLAADRRGGGGGRAPPGRLRGLGGGAGPPLAIGGREALIDGGLRPLIYSPLRPHENPAGVSLAADRRGALVELARRYGFLVFEDVAYRELDFGGDSPPSLWSIGPDVVVQAGTTSKTFCPGVRLGWAVGPAEVASRLVDAKQLTDQCAGALGQRLFEESERRGWIDEQLVRSRELYGRKGEKLLAALERSTPDSAHWTTPRGGFFSWLTLPGVDAVDLAARAVEQGVAAVPGTLFFPDGRGQDSLRLSFSMVDEAKIDEGIARLCSLV